MPVLTAAPAGPVRPRSPGRPRGPWNTQEQLKHELALGHSPGLPRHHRRQQLCPHSQKAKVQRPRCCLPSSSRTPPTPHLIQGVSAQTEPPRLLLTLPGALSPARLALCHRQTPQNVEKRNFLKLKPILAQGYGKEMLVNLEQIIYSINVPFRSDHSEIRSTKRSIFSARREHFTQQNHRLA